MRQQPNLFDKGLGLVAGLAASASAFAHGPHVEVQGTGAMETLLHLMAHAWPVVPIVAAYLLVRHVQADK
jgi:hypothetical protein